MEACAGSSKNETLLHVIVRGVCSAVKNCCLVVRGYCSISPLSVAVRDRRLGIAEVRVLIRFGFWRM